MKPYPAYKPTDLDWLPQVPAHWEVKRADRLFTKRSEPAQLEDEVVTAFITGQVTLRKNVRPEGLKNAMNFSMWKRIYPGDLAISGMNVHLGGLGISDSEGKMSPIYLILRPKGEICAPYLSITLRQLALTGFVTSILTTIRFNSADFRHDDVRKLFIPYPPLDEQERIVKYLGAKHREIERYIAAKRKLLLRLGELSAATISRAVTRGLNADVALKPSGVEWLDSLTGGVPEHWEIKKLAWCASLKSGDAITAQNIEQDSGDYPVYGGNGFRGYATSFTHSGHYALIGRQGALCGNINYGNGEFFASEHAVVVTPRPFVLTGYLGELLRAMNLNQYSMTAAQPGLSVEVISKLKIPVPPLAEQTAIVAYLESQLAIIGEARGRIEREIELARELYQTLVANVVTGQVDVSGIEVEDDKSQFVDELSEVDDELSDVVDELSNVDDELSEVEDDG